MYPKVRGNERRHGKNTQVTQVDRQKHRVFLRRRIPTGFVANGLVHPGCGRLKIGLHLATSRCDIPPERASRGGSNDLDCDPLLATKNNTVFTGGVRGGIINDRCTARRGKNIEHAREYAFLSVFADIDGWLNMGANTLLDEGRIRHRATGSGISDVLPATVQGLTC